MEDGLLMPPDGPLAESDWHVQRREEIAVATY